ncbi:hypothetical protein scyTo_0021159, partial [Scyliorhinus torazame]|nr:hypothetical protein [Scyliorhinus torazame]
DAALCYDGESSEPYSDIGNNVLFREGLTLRGQATYTPRLILMDLKGSLSSLKQEGALYGGEVDSSRNLNSTAFQGEERAAPLSVAARPLDLSHGTYRLESNVRVWSDYLRVHLHPKTISVIQQYNHSSTADRFEAFGFGEKLMRDPSFLDDFEDRLHFYIEECDYLQGFHVLCDLQDGFAGLSAKVVELLNDEYGGRGIFTCGFTPTSYADTVSMEGSGRTVCGHTLHSKHLSLGPGWTLSVCPSWDAVGIKKNI